MQASSPLAPSSHLWRFVFYWNTTEKGTHDMSDWIKYLIAAILGMVFGPRLMAVVKH